MAPWVPEFCLQSVYFVTSCQTLLSISETNKKKPNKKQNIHHLDLPNLVRIELHYCKRFCNWSSYSLVSTSWDIKLKILVLILCLSLWVCQICLLNLNLNKYVAGSKDGLNATGPYIVLIFCATCISACYLLVKHCIIHDMDLLNFVRIKLQSCKDLVIGLVIQLLHTVMNC